MSANVGTMALYLHHVPGRLRVCLSKLKGSPRAVAPLTRELLAMPGAESVSVSARTGSVTIRYRRDVFDAEDLWARLHALGFLDRSGAPECASPSASTDSLAARAASAVGEAFASAAIRHVLDRSTWSLIKILG